MTEDTKREQAVNIIARQIAQEHGISFDGPARDAVLQAARENYKRLADSVVKTFEHLSMAA